MTTVYLPSTLSCQARPVQRRWRKPSLEKKLDWRVPISVVQLPRSAPAERDVNL
jgi:hypothetical protein